MDSENYFWWIAARQLREFKAAKAARAAFGDAEAPEASRPPMTLPGRKNRLTHDNADSRHE